jgi:hypothetical protein
MKVDGEAGFSADRPRRPGRGEPARAADLYMGIVAVRDTLDPLSDALEDSSRAREQRHRAIPPP